MLDAEIESYLVGILREVSGNFELLADKRTILHDIPEWDSMSTVEAILLIESRLVINTTFDGCHAVVTVGELLTLVMEAVTASRNTGGIHPSAPPRLNFLAAAPVPG